MSNAASPAQVGTSTSSAPRKVRVNIGCGMTPTHGWRNFDNSPSLLLARFPWTTSLLAKLKIISPPQLNYIQFLKLHGISYASATSRLPLEDESAEVIYSSHMVEHLDRAEAQFFFGEARRCLVKTGILRIVVPDLRMIVDRYLATGNADEAVAALMLAQPKPRGIAQRLLRLLVEWRDHRWMYDGDSLKGALEVAGYSHVQILPPGETLISDPAGLNLRERERNSVYVEAIK